MKSFRFAQRVSRLVIHTCFCSVFIPNLFAQDEIHQQLDNARTTYDQETEKLRLDIGKWFEKEDATARNATTDISARVAEVRRERAVYESEGALPKRVPPELRTRQIRIGDALIRAYRKASDEYSRNKMDEEAAAIDQEREQFELTRIPLIMSADRLIGTIWDMSYKYRGEEKYLHRIELSKNGVIRGSKHQNETYWEVDKGKLLFRDNKRQVTTIFDQITQKGSATTITGLFQPRKGCIHVLESISKPGPRRAK